MINITVIGAGGRMGREIIGMIPEDTELMLVGAIERTGAQCLGSDAGRHAGVELMNVHITSDLSTVIELTDVVIDFSSAESVSLHLNMLEDAKTAVVIGTTGLSDLEKDRIQQYAHEGGRIVWASNMSVGVNLLFILCEQASRILGDEYDIEIIDVHHGKKKDSPSGTAEKLVEILAKSRGLDVMTDISYGRKGLIGERPKNEIGMHSLRGGDVIGEHTVLFATLGERIELVHKASSRSTFAKGALRAAKFIVDAGPGLYDMRQVLGLS